MNNKLLAALAALYSSARTVVRNLPAGVRAKLAPIGFRLAELRARFAPNRVAVYLTATADILAALLVIVADLDAEGAVAVLTSLAALNAKALLWLRGWQSYEQDQRYAEYRKS